MRGVAGGDCTELSVETIYVDLFATRPAGSISRAPEGLRRSARGSMRAGCLLWNPALDVMGLVSRPGESHPRPTYQGVTK